MQRALIGLTFALAATGCVTDQDILGQHSQEIVGGTSTQITTVPWQVSLQDANGHFCGGTIVSPTWIVTAAHCVTGITPTKIVAGISQLSQAGAGQSRTIKRIIAYPGYTDASQGKDAALIELASALTLDNTKTKAIRVVTASSPQTLTAPGVMATVSGWGLTTETAQNLPDQLNSVQVPIVSNTTASTAYNMTITADQLAAGFTQGGKDSCQGDSGGPLVVYDGTEPKLAGIVSWGDGCARANIPGMYGRVTSFAQWMGTYVGGPPTAAAGDDVAVKPGTRVTLDGSASADAFGSIASYAWKQVSGASVTLDSANAMTASFTAPSSTGQVEFELTVTDDAGTTATDRVVVTISANGTGTGTGTGGGTGGGGGGDGLGDNEVVGGCAATGGSSAGLVLVLLGLCVGRRRRVRA